MSSGAERLCDSCQNKMTGFNLRVDLVNDPDRPQNRVLALVLACTRTPPLLVVDGKEVPNPDWRAEETVDCARRTIGADICCLDCFLNLMQDFWKLAERRAKRLWATGERDWR